MKLFISLFLILTWPLSLDNNDLVRRIISDDDYNYTFYISTKEKVSVEDFKEYFWYRTGSIHNAVGGVDGQVLHGPYKKTYRNNGLAEQGEFRYGLKIKTWTSWFENGKVEKITHWQAGVLSGGYKEFDTRGALLVSGKYKNNRKHGVWVNHQTKDTLYFKKGEKIVKEELPEEEAKKNKDTNKKSFKVKAKEFFNTLFKKKTPEEKQKLKKEKENKKKQRELEKKRKELAKKKEELKNKSSVKQ